MGLWEGRLKVERVTQARDPPALPWRCRIRIQNLHSPLVQLLLFLSPPPSTLGSLRDLSPSLSHGTCVPVVICAPTVLFPSPQVSEDGQTR